MRILVTGCGGRLAKALLPRLLAAARIKYVIGIDTKAPQFAHPRFGFIRADIRDIDLAAHFANVDVLIHLACVVMQADLGAQRNNRELMRDINVAGGQNIFNLAAAAGVRQMIHLSSAAVYALPASVERIDESQPLGALPGFGYAEDKIALERWLDEFEAIHPDIRVVRLRPHAIVGPHAHPYLLRLLRTPLYPRLGKPAPLTQCVHEEDVVAAIRLAIFDGARGAYNLACSDALSLRTLQRRLHLLALPVPAGVMRVIVKKGWDWFGWGTDPAWLQALGHSLALDTTRARTELRWMPRYDFAHACHHALHGKPADTVEKNVAR